MTRKIGILLLIVVMLFSAGFDAVYEPDESELSDQNTEEVLYDEYTDTDGDEEVSEESPEEELSDEDSLEEESPEEELSDEEPLEEESPAEELSDEEPLEEESPEEELSDEDPLEEESPAEELPVEEPPTEIPPTEVSPTEVPPTEVPPTEVSPTEVPPTEVPPTEVPPTEVPPTEVPPTEVPPTEIPPTPEPEIPSWIGIDEDQVEILTQLFWQMTNTGRTYSGWFNDGDYDPCDWQGITCENGRVVRLSFENAGFFTVFPEWILEFRDLKELRMSDTLVRGTLPDRLFAALAKLEKLELSGNFFTGEIPDLPAAFEVYPMLQTIVISDNREDDRKAELLFRPEYGEIAGFWLDPQEYPGIDLTPGLDGSLPADWNRLPLLSKADLSKNSLNGNIPDSFGQIPFAELDLSENGSGLQISRALYDYWASLSNPALVLDGLNAPAEVIPTEVLPTEPAPPEELPTQPADPVQNTPEPPVQPTQVIVTVVLTEVPTAIPTEEQTLQPTTTPSKKREKATETPVVIVATPTPVPQWYYPTQPYYYPTATPYTYTNPYWQYPTATPYFNPSWIYPTATSAYSNQPQYVPTAEPTQDPASMLGFTYTMTEMTGNNIPMTWRYTGMTQYSINYLDANDELYPQFAMEWKPASELCNSSVCNASVQNIPQELLNGGNFSLQLRAQDGAGRTYVSDPVRMEVSVPQTAPDSVPTPEPEPQRSFWGGFFHWLFGPLIRLFGGS